MLLYIFCKWLKDWCVLHFVVTSSAGGGREGVCVLRGSRDLVFVNGRARAVQVSVARAYGGEREATPTLAGLPRRVFNCVCVFVCVEKCKRFLQEFYTEDDSGKKVFKYGAQLVRTSG